MKRPVNIEKAIDKADKDMLEYFMPTLTYLLSGKEEGASRLEVEIPNPRKGIIRINRTDGMRFTITVEKKGN